MNKILLRYRTENPFATCGTVSGSGGKRKLTGTCQPSRKAYRFLG
jgi:hypothetical protein